jgi:hypothetical protein
LPPTEPWSGNTSEPMVASPMALPAALTPFCRRAYSCRVGSVQFMVARALLPLADDTKG